MDFSIYRTNPLANFVDIQYEKLQSNVVGGVRFFSHINPSKSLVYVRYEVFTAVGAKINILWAVTSCLLVGVYRIFGGM
jgi:hypothetical protein